MIFVSFRCFFSVFHTKCLASVYTAPTERLRYSLSIPLLHKTQKSSVWTILQWVIMDYTTTAILHTFFARWTVSSYPSNGKTAHSRT